MGWAETYDRDIIPLALLPKQEYVKISNEWENNICNQLSKLPWMVKAVKIEIGKIHIIDHTTLGSSAHLVYAKVFHKALGWHSHDSKLNLSLRKKRHSLGTQCPPPSAPAISSCFPYGPWIGKSHKDLFYLKMEVVSTL